MRINIVYVAELNTEKTCWSQVPAALVQLSGPSCEDPPSRPATKELEEQKGSSNGPCTIPAGTIRAQQLEVGSSLCFAAF